MIYLVQNDREYDYDVRAIALAFYERTKIVEVTKEEFEEIEENEYVKEVENNGNSGQHYNLIWYTVYGENDEFDIYS